MKTERIQQIYADIQSVTIPLPNTDALSYRDINGVLCKCDDFLGKLQKYLIEVVNDTDFLDRQMGAKQDVYDTSLEEKIISSPEMQSLSTDTAKLRRAKYLMRKEAEELRNLKTELSESKSLEKIILGHRKSTEQKINSAKKIWEMHNSHLRAFTGSSRPTESLTFTDPFVETLVRGTAEGTDDATDDQLGAEVDFQKNSTREAAPGELYKAEASNKGDNGEKSKVEPKEPSIISEEGGDLSDILDSL